MKKYIKLFDSIYELTFKDEHKDLVFLILYSQPTIDLFEEFCLSWNIPFKLNRIGDYCHRSEIMKNLIFKENV